MSKVSIVIPTYNQANFLAEAIESALQQNHRDTEIIVVDDGSTDETRLVTAEYEANKKIKLIRQSNIGLPGARNRGLAEATGDHICFLDSDDCYSPSKIDKQTLLLDENPDIGFVYCDILTIDENGQPVSDQYSVGRPDRNLSGDIFQSLLMGGYFPPHTVMIRQSILKELGGFDVNCGGHADYELWLRVAGSGHKACFQNEQLAYYRKHPDNMSKNGLHMSDTRILTFDRILRRFPEKMAKGVNFLQQSAQEFFSANRWLSDKCQNLQRELTALQDVCGQPVAKTVSEKQRFFVLDHLKKVALIEGLPDQLATWEVELQERYNRAIFLHPPAQIRIEIPLSCRGFFVTAAIIHPEAWEKLGTGGCEFKVIADDNISYSAVINPNNNLSDRDWHEIRINVPETPKEIHRVQLITKSVGKDDFRWALWRDPVFVMA